MKNRFYLFVYFLILILFPFIQKQFIPRPTLKKLELISEVKDYHVKSNYFYNDLDESFKREINIGDTYLITDFSNKTFQITPISSWSIKNLDLQKISKDLPDLIIQNSEIREFNNNNYAVGIIQDEYFSQACLVNRNSYFFDKLKLNVAQYWEIKYWLEILKNSLKNNLIIYRSKSENCFLITSSDLDNFREDIIKIYKLINFK